MDGSRGGPRALRAPPERSSDRRGSRARLTHQAGGVEPASTAEPEHEPGDTDDTAGGLVWPELDADVLQSLDEVAVVGDRTEHGVLLDELAGRHAAECERRVAPNSSAMSRNVVVSL